MRRLSKRIGHYYTPEQKALKLADPIAIEKKTLTRKFMAGKYLQMDIENGVRRAIINSIEY